MGCMQCDGMRGTTLNSTDGVMGDVGESWHNQNNVFVVMTDI